MALSKSDNNPGALRPVTVRGERVYWLGEVNGKDTGFSSFKSPVYGVRAFYINLFQQMKRGRDTFAEITPIYAPFGDGANNPNIYAANLSRMTGIGKDEKLNPSDRVQMLKVGKAFFRQEGVFMPSDADITAGYEMAVNRKLKTIPTGLNLVPIALLSLLVILYVYG